MEKLLEIKELSVELMSTRGLVHAVQGIDLDIEKGSIHGLVGESGCGKSVTAKAVLRMHDRQRTRVRGEILFQGTDLLALPFHQMRRLRGKEISMIFQDPMTSLNPLYPVGEQISEIFRHHEKLSREDARKRSLELLERVGIFPPERRYTQYPFEFSGGMLQRVVIAMAIACNPALIIADEPTTALDVTIQAQILDLLKELQKDLGISVLMITHNFGIVSEVCDKVSVMYAGKILETGDTWDVLKHAANPYSQALIRSIPQSGVTADKLPTIPGSPPELFQKLPGCPYASRCPQRMENCLTEMPPLQVVTGSESGSHLAACHSLRKGGEPKNE